VGFALSGRRYSGWEVEEDMCAMEEQARRVLAESGSGLRGLAVGHLPDACNKSDPTWGERTREKAENNERRRQELAGRPTVLSRDCILTTRPDSAPQRLPLAVGRGKHDRPRMLTLAVDPLFHPGTTVCPSPGPHRVSRPPQLILVDPLMVHLCIPLRV